MNRVIQSIAGEWLQRRSCGSNGALVSIAIRIFSTVLHLAVVSTLGTSSGIAGIVSVNLTSPNNITGPNAGLAYEARLRYFNFPIAGKGIEFYNGALNDEDITNGDPSSRIWGLDGVGGLNFAVNASTSANPRNFGNGSLIDSTATYSGADFYTGFRRVTSDSTDTKSPAFGSNNYMGFRMRITTGEDYFGWVEVTWNGTDTFEVLRLAYETTPNVAIAAGDLGGANQVPEPSTMVIGALLGLGGLIGKRRLKQ